MSDKILYQPDIYIFGKDRQGRYLFANEKFSMAAGADSPASLIGKNDSIVAWKEFSEIFRRGDSRVISGQAMYNEKELIKFGGSVRKIVTTKSQLLNQKNNCIGVIGSFFEVSEGTSRNNGHYYCLKTKRFYLSGIFHGVYLTRAEYNVFKQILLGQTAKQIAKILCKANRTVQHQTASIKSKLQCKSKGDIIYTAIKHKLAHIEFPELIYQ